MGDLTEDGASPSGRAATPSGPSPSVSGIAGIPDADGMHSGMLAAIRAVLAGDYPEARGLGSPYATAHALGLLADETQTKPCRECGKPRPDFTYPRVTLAGKAYLALAQAIEARRVVPNGTVHESAVGAADVPNPNIPPEQANG